VTFLVWDTLNSEEKWGRCIEADCAEEAAIQYADDDVDGRCDGLYLGPDGGPMRPADGHPIAVRDGDGKKLVFLVSIEEFEPVWGAHLEGA
jgi:hypothetical protein